MTSYTPVDFSGQCPPVRIIGTETEYYLKPGPPSPGRIADGLAALGITSVNGYCSNGARIYPEYDIEYATPECPGPAQAAAADFAGMAIINKLIDHQTGQGENKAFPALRHAGSYDILDRKTASRGYHQNFLTPKPINSDRHNLLRAVMSSFLATRISWDGAGLVTEDNFLLSQKAPGVGEPVINGYGSRTSHGRKPLAGFMIGGASPADDKIGYGWALLEVRSADSHMSEHQSYLSLAATSLALRLIEQGTISGKNAKNFVLDRPVGALHTTNYNLGRSKLKLVSGKSVTAANLQESFAEQMQKMSSDVFLPEDEVRAISKLLTICQRLGDTSIDGLVALAPDVEWATKLYYLQRKYGENAWALRTSEAIAFDLQWHRTDDRSVGLKVYSKYEQAMGKASQNKDVSYSPPRTRAAARGGVIAGGDCAGAGWSYVLPSNGQKIDLDDYWCPDLPGVAPRNTRLLSRIA